jgi:lysophospholipase L1-like esterase
MQQYAEPVTDRSGNAIEGARVSVFNIDGSLASLFAADGVTGILNPVTTNSNGFAVFCAANGNYKRQVTINGSTFDVPGQIVLSTPSGYLTTPDLAAASASSLIGFGGRTLANKLGESVSITDAPFNARTSASDATNLAAFTAAAAAVSGTATRVYVPPGTYTATIPSTFDWGAFYGPGVVAIGALSFRVEYLTTPRYTLGQLIAKMAKGDVVKLAAFGDSTTDGNTTTGWTANPVDGSSNAIGTTDHAATAPNSWPVKLQAILRDMYAGTNVSVYNAGYSGQKLNDGWAMRNYDQAVLKNSSYGAVDMCFIAFGLNDIVDAGFLSAHITETVKLCKKILGYGALPVLLTSDAEFRTTFADGSRDHKIASRQLNAAKAEIATKLGMPIFDMDLAMRGWFERNLDGYKWYEVQPDALHVNDAGHALKASFLASQLFRDTLRVTDSHSLALSHFDSRSSYVGGRGFGSTASNTRWGANNVLASTEYTAGQVLMTAWVWNEQPDCTLIYRHIDNDGSDVRSNAPQIVVKEFIAGSNLFSDKIDNAGSKYNSARRASGRPSPICQLYYGLHKVTYVAPPAATGTNFFGHFEVAPNYQAGLKNKFLQRGMRSVNALKNTGPLFYKAAASSGVTVRLSDETADGSNIMSFGRDGKSVSLFLEMQIDAGTGVTLMSGKGWSTTAGVKYPVVALLMYRATTGIRLYMVTIDSSNTVLFTGLVSLVTYTPTGLQKFKFKFGRDATNTHQVVNVWTDWTETTSLFSLDLSEAADMVPYAGYFGDLYSNTADNAAGGVIHITQAMICYE